MCKTGRKFKRQIARQSNKPGENLSAQHNDEGPDDQIRSGSIRASRTEVSYWAGPMPPPEEIAKYNGAYPDAAKIIFEGFRDQGEHRRWMEKRAIIGAQRRSWGGLVSASLLSLFIVGVGGFLIYNKHDTAGATIITSTLVALAATFLYGQSSQHKDLQDKKAKTKQLEKPKREEAEA